MKKLLIDNSALSLTGCDRLLQLKVFDGLYVENKAATDFGSAYHKAMELLDKGEEPESVVSKVLTSAPSVDQVKLLTILNQVED